MKKIFCLVILLILLTNSALALERPIADEAAFYNAQAIAMIAEELYIDALRNSKRAIETDPAYAEAYYYEGVALSCLGYDEEAIADFTKAIELDMLLTAAYSSRGNSYNNLGRYAEALVDLNLAIILDPDFIMAYNNRGNSLFYLGRYTEAVADYDRVLALNPDESLLTTAAISKDIALKQLRRMEKATGKIVITSPGSVNIRADENAESEILYRAQTGDVFEYLGQSNTSYMVALPDGMIGYISSGLAKFRE